MKTVTEKKLNQTFDITETALKSVEIALPNHSEMEKTAKDFLQMATNYISDAKHFQQKGDFVRAFGALYYAHAWLDAGARMGIFEIKENRELFTVD